MHDALRILAARDVVEHPELTNGRALELRSAEHLRQLVQLAERHPAMTARQLADQVVMAAAFDQSSTYDPDTYELGLDAARRALRHLDDDA